jgi:hypothetical protein
VSWLTFTTDFGSIKPVLMRIADALDRIAPPPEPAAADLKPEEAVTYVDEEALAKQEAIDEMGADAKRIEQYLLEHPEEAAEAEAHDQL